MLMKEKSMNSQSLADIQGIFWDALKKSDMNITAIINGDETFTPQQRMEVYRNNARSLHASVLADVYAIGEKVLGNDYFKQLTKNYFSKYPSRCADLNQYGKDFPRYLERMSLLRPELNEYQYLSDLAMFEWNIQKSHFSADNVNLQLQEFQQVCLQDGGDAVFSLQPSVSIMASKYPVAQLWEMHQGDEENEMVEFSLEQNYLCIFRKEFEVLYEYISADQYLLLNAIKNRKSLSEIAEFFIESERLNEALETILIKQWI